MLAGISGGSGFSGSYISLHYFDVFAGTEVPAIFVFLGGEKGWLGGILGAVGAADRLLHGFLYMIVIQHLLAGWDVTFCLTGLILCLYA